MALYISSLLEYPPVASVTAPSVLESIEKLQTGGIMEPGKELIDVDIVH
jgi:hypothetical protein